MSMNPTLTESRATPRTFGEGLVMVASVAIVLVVAVVLGPSLRLPHYVARVTLDNPTEYRLEVEVTDVNRGGWLPLGEVGRDGSKVAYEVIDQGSRWLFHFSSGGVDAGEAVVSRDDLRHGGWKLAIPPDVGNRLRAQGVPPSSY